MFYKAAFPELWSLNSPGLSPTWTCMVYQVAIAKFQDTTFLEKNHISKGQPFFLCKVSLLFHFYSITDRKKNKRRGIQKELLTQILTYKKTVALEVKEK